MQELKQYKKMKMEDQRKRTRFHNNRRRLPNKMKRDQYLPLAKHFYEIESKMWKCQESMKNKKKKTQINLLQEKVSEENSSPILIKTDDLSLENRAHLCPGLLKFLFFGMMIKIIGSNTLTQWLVKMSK